MVSGDEMSKKEKRKAKILEKPARSDITFDEMNSFLIDMGFQEKNTRNGGSHRLYMHKKSSMPVNIQSKNGLIQKYQVLQVQKIIEEILADGGE